MKKIILLILISVMLLTSCNQQTTISYNDTIVLAHKNLLETNENFFKECENYIGKPESKKQLLLLIQTAKSKLIEGKKPVEALVPFEDHGLRETMLDMYSNSEYSMDIFTKNADVITGSANQNETLLLFEKEYSKLVEFDKLIKELQIQYAYYNKVQLR